MKKLLALLLACMTLTCAFASCGDSDDDKDEKTSKSDKADKDEDDEDSDEDEDEDDKDSDDEDEEEDDEEEEETTKKKKKASESEDEDEDDEEEEEETEAEAVDIEIGKFSSSVKLGDIAGMWECYAMIEDDETYVGEYMGMPLGALFQLTIEDDGTFSITTGVDPDEAEEGTINISGDEIALTVDDETIFAGYDGTYLVLQEDDSYDAEEKIVMVSVDKFTEFDYDAWMEEMMGQFEE